LGAPCRMYARPRLAVLEQLRKIESDLDDGRPRDEARAAWRTAVQARAGWGAPDRHAWLLGQDAAFPSGVARRFRTVAGALPGLWRERSPDFAKGFGRTARRRSGTSRSPRTPRWRVRTERRIRSFRAR